ncbi:Anaphase-promoting complex, subunit 15/MND2 [Purpureocillium lilacinum]|uniref:Anaphase-promoting complex, subunit 15/MND2 n=1 Tax=Purpureocillium lilacinum TaxID=33203 RepID=A0A179HFJ9_PURLI|nr:Anaphase-promoting complex, subunit 15/MND2 [Purpureocillium lilacinum]OAQ88732.1 Anaphase-promoting complex, subunit 15/MND2 [Purpureocillium lilacinum]
MFATLPDFTPRDSHSLWYTSSRAPVPSHGLYDAHHADHHHNNHHHAGNGHAAAAAAGSHHARSQRGHVMERTALARLAADEQYMHRRRLNVQNFGSGWLKPPGVPKTLHQMREEKREQEEHQEALRREQVAQELAEAEAAGMPEDNMMDDVQLDGAQDLDDDIPDADADDHFDMGSDDEDEEDEDEDDEGDEEDEGVGGDANGDDDEALREERQNDLMAARMRMADDAFREALVRGDTDADELYVGDEIDPEEEEHGHMLEEDDFASHLAPGGSDDDGMGADLDDDIPEAESGGYEHTDSEAELSSSSGGGGGGGGPYDDDDDEDDDEEGDEDEDEGDDDDHDIGFAPRAAPLGPPQSPTLRGRASLAAPRASMDLSNLLSQDESSFMDSSPAAGRRARHG